MKTSKQGIDFIAQWEGLRLAAYQDVKGVWTIGYGHTGSAARPGNTITETEAKRLLRLDLDEAEAGVRAAVRVPLSQTQFDVLVSFAFNCGNHALATSTLARKLNAGDYAAVPAELARWVHSGGKRVQGLVNRRAAEAVLWRGSYPAPNTGRPEETNVVPEAPRPPRKPVPLGSGVPRSSVVDAWRAVPWLAAAAVIAFIVYNVATRML